MYTNVLFRWAVWNPTPDLVAMFEDSLSTFKRFFTDTASYVLLSDMPDAVRAMIRTPVEVLDMRSLDSPFFDERATWKKWAPKARLDISKTEFHVDADFFLLDDPIELRSFIEAGGHQLLASAESFPELWPYGNFSSCLDPSLPAINTGLIGQKAGFSIEPDLADAYELWSYEVCNGGDLYHDEQGAVAYCFQKYLRSGSAKVLDGSKYKIVSPLNRETVHDLVGLTAIHATNAGHPAYHRFLLEIRRVAGFSGQARESGG